MRNKFYSCSKIWILSNAGVRVGLSDAGGLGGEFSLLPLRRAEWGFLLNLPSPNFQMLFVKKEYQRPV